MEKIKRTRPWKKLLLSLVMLVFIFLPIVSVFAKSMSGDTVTIESNETLEETTSLSGGNIRVDGDINGTTFVTGGDIEINGTIDGDLFVAGQRLTVNGTVRGSVFLTGQYLTVNGEVENNIYGAGQGLKLQSRTDGNIFMVGQNVSIDEDAVIERDAFIGANSIYHKGLVNGDFQSSSNSLTLGGKIVGDLNYSSQKQANFLDTSEVQGDSNWKKIERASTKEMKTFFSTALILRVLWSIGAALIVWLVVRWVRPNLWPELADQIQLNPLKTLGFGALGLVFIPILSILFIITIIGIPLSLILLTLYGVTLYISKIIVSVYFSRSLQKRLNGSTRHAFWVFLLALILLTSLGSLPIVGLIIRLFIAALGIGATGFLLKNRQTRP